MEKKLTYTNSDGCYIYHHVNLASGECYEWRATLECEGHNGQRVFTDLANQGTDEGLLILRQKIKRLKKEGSPHGNRYFLIKSPYKAFLTRSHSCKP